MPSVSSVWCQVPCTDSQANETRSQSCSTIFQYQDRTLAVVFVSFFGGGGGFLVRVRVIVLFFLTSSWRVCPTLPNLPVTFAEVSFWVSFPWLLWENILRRRRQDQDFSRFFGWILNSRTCCLWRVLPFYSWTVWVEWVVWYLFFSFLIPDVEGSSLMIIGL